MRFLTPKHILRDLDPDDGARGCYNTSRNLYNNAPDIFHELNGMDIDTITHKKCLQLTLKLLRYEVKYQHDLIRNIEAPQNLGFFKTILWQLTTGKQKKAACKKEIQKAQSYIYDVEYVLSLLRSYEYVEDAYGYYDEIADREHSIADQWNYGGPTNQAHIREGNKYRHRANNLAKGYQLALDAHLHYFKVLSKRIYG